MRASARFQLCVYAKNTVISPGPEVWLAERGECKIVRLPYGTKKVSIALKREHVFPPYQLFHLNRGHRRKRRPNGARPRQNCKLRWKYPAHVEHPTSKIRGLEGGGGGGRTGFRECAAGYVIHRTALFRPFSLFLPERAESWRRVFVTTKLREKFVARIPAAGARSHARGERKRRGQAGRVGVTRTSETRRKV